MVRIECGIVEGENGYEYDEGEEGDYEEEVEVEDDESLPINLRDRQRTFVYSELGDHEDTSKCWSMAERYKGSMLLQK